MIYPWQTTGVDWLRTKTRALLGDEQGMGKSITAILAARAAGCRRVLVIAPTVVAYNWENELRRWAPEWTVEVCASSNQMRAVQFDCLNVIIVTHTGTINGRITTTLQRREFDLIIVDEAHCFRNESAQRTRALYGTGGLIHRAKRVWLLTGTPMPNHAGELWPMLRGLWPDRCPYGFEEFRDRFCEKRWDYHRNDWKIVGNKKDTLPELRAMLNGVVLRRLKKDHLKDLPPIRWETVVLPPGVVSKALAAFNKQFAGMPAEEALAALQRHVEFAAWRRLCGVAKIEPATELLAAELEGTTHKTVVFAHHLDVLAGIEKGLGVPTVKITGDVSAQDRTRLVTLFQNDPKTRVALCQITAAGVGITMTAAEEVVFVEQSWVPADNAQAADRCHRIGQTKPVRARFLALAGTVDQLVAEALARKTAAINEVLSEK